MGSRKFKQLEASKNALQEELTSEVTKIREDHTALKSSEQQLRDELIRQNTLLSELIADKLNLEKEIRSLNSTISQLSDESESAQAVLNQELQRKNESLQRKELTLNQLIEKFQQQDELLKTISSALSNELSSYSEEEVEWYMVDQQLDLVFYNDKLFSTRKEITARGKAILDQLIKIIKEYPSLMIVVEGHTDNDLKNVNTSLESSALNGAKVARYLLDPGGINNNQIQVASKGGFSPRVSNQTPAGRQLNNRVEIHLHLSPIEINRLIKDQF